MNHEIDGKVMLDRDKDGIPDVLQQPTNETEIQQTSELEGALKELNSDDLNEVSNMSDIDMRTRLHSIEICSILAIDSLVRFKVLPDQGLTLTRQKKRLAVSLNGEGRKEIVEVVAGKREDDINKAGGSFIDRAKNLFGGNKEESK